MVVSLVVMGKERSHITVRSPRGLSMPAVAMNKNTNWLNNKAAWLFYVILIFMSWLIASSWTDPGMAWTYVHIGHGIITYYLLHWIKGSPIPDDQGKYDTYVLTGSCRKNIILPFV